MQRFTGYVSSYERVTNTFTIRVVKDAELFKSPTIEVRELAQGVTLRKYDSVTFIVRKHLGTPYAYDVRPVSPEKKPTKRMHR